MIYEFTKEVRGFGQLIQRDIQMRIHTVIIAFASTVSGRHLDTQVLKSHTLGHPNIFLRVFFLNVSSKLIIKVPYLNFVPMDTMSYFHMEILVHG